MSKKTDTTQRDALVEARKAKMRAERSAQVKIQLKNSVYRTLVSLVGAMVKHMPVQEAVGIVEAELANIKADLEKAEKKAARRLPKGDTSLEAKK